MRLTQMARKRRDRPETLIRLGISSGYYLNALYVLKIKDGFNCESYVPVVMANGTIFGRCLGNTVKDAEKELLKLNKGRNEN